VFPSTDRFSPVLSFVISRRFFWIISCHVPLFLGSIHLRFWAENFLTHLIFPPCMLHVHQSHPLHVIVLRAFDEEHREIPALSSASCACVPSSHRSKYSQELMSSRVGRHVFGRQLLTLLR
jgi:hypothetical protein